MVRKQYSKSDIRDLIASCSFLDGLLDKKSNVVEEDDLLFVNKNLVAIRFEGNLVPSLKMLISKTDLLPKVVVDKGAIKFVVKGADVMRPGIVSVGSFQCSDFVVIVDETYGKPLAVGKSLFDSKTLLEMKEGKVLLNLHQIGDKFWEKSQ
ncbi:RNA-binding protein [Candidatus Woesearchaeota archaeon]|nr:RNA-binding protein [Candidatus Woesearchaeota archaeon]